MKRCGLVILLVLLSLCTASAYASTDLNLEEFKMLLPHRAVVRVFLTFNLSKSDRCSVEGTGVVLANSQPIDKLSFKPKSAGCNSGTETGSVKKATIATSGTIILNTSVTITPPTTPTCTYKFAKIESTSAIPTSEIAFPNTVTTGKLVRAGSDPSCETTDALPVEGSFSGYYVSLEGSLSE